MFSDYIASNIVEYCTVIKIPVLKNNDTENIHNVIWKKQDTKYTVWSLQQTYWVPTPSAWTFPTPASQIPPRIYLFPYLKGFSKT